MTEATMPQEEVGAFEFTVLGAGRQGRRTATRFAARCDAVALHDAEIMLLSVSAAETSVQGASPHQLVGLLYDALLQALATAQVEQESPQPIAASVPQAGPQPCSTAFTKSPNLTAAS